MSTPASSDEMAGTANAPHRPPHGATEMSRLVEESVRTIQEVDMRLQLIRNELAALVGGAAVPRPWQQAAALPPGGMPPATGRTPWMGRGAPTTGGGPTPLQAPDVCVPPVDVVDTGDALVIMVDLPGVTKDELDLTVDDRQLRIMAKRLEPTRIEGEVLVSEAGGVRYGRILPLPTSVLVDDATAEMRGGILTVRIPKREPTGGPRRLDVNEA